MRVTAPDGQTMELAELGPGEYFGEIGLLTGSERHGNGLDQPNEVMALAVSHVEALYRLQLNAQRNQSFLIW